MSIVEVLNQSIRKNNYPLVIEEGEPRDTGVNVKIRHVWTNKTMNHFFDQLIIRDIDEKMAEEYLKFVIQILGANREY